MNTDYKKLSDDELLAWYRNAKVTGALCGGHGKAEANRHLASSYAEELTARGLAIPQYNAQGNMDGEFNGPGST